MKQMSQFIKCPYCAHAGTNAGHPLVGVRKAGIVFKCLGCNTPFLLNCVTTVGFCKEFVKRRMPIIEVSLTKSEGRA